MRKPRGRKVRRREIGPCVRAESIGASKFSVRSFERDGLPSDAEVISAVLEFYADVVVVVRVGVYGRVWACGRRNDPENGRQTLP